MSPPTDSLLKAILAELACLPDPLPLQAVVLTFASKEAARPVNAAVSRSKEVCQPQLGGWVYRRVNLEPRGNEAGWKETFEGAKEGEWRAFLLPTPSLLPVEKQEI